MKKLLIAITIFLFLPLFLQAQQVVSYSVKDFFTNNDSVQIKSGDTYYWYYSNSSADTVTSDIIYLRGGGGDITITGKITNISGSMNTTVQVGLYFGPEYGYDWYTMITTTSDTTFKFNFVDQSWGDSDITGQYSVRFLRTGTQRNKYAIRLNHYNW